jgi:hypothetical protein
MEVLNLSASISSYLIPASLVALLALFPMLMWLDKATRKDNGNK